MTIMEAVGLPTGTPGNVPESTTNKLSKMEFSGVPPNYD